MSADLAALADEALYAEQWLLQGQPVGSLTPMASKMREIEAVLRALAAADEKMPVVGGRCKACNEVGASHCSDPVNCAGMVNHVRQSDAQAAVLAAELEALLDEVRCSCTRDDDLPDNLLQRIDAALDKDTP